MPEIVNAQDGFLVKLLSSRLYILDSYDTYAAFIAAHPTGTEGDAYLAAGWLYVWGASTQAWVNSGNLASPYYTPHVSAEGLVSWTNSADLDNPANVDLMTPFTAAKSAAQGYALAASTSADEAAASANNAESSKSAAAGSATAAASSADASQNSASAAAASAATAGTSADNSATSESNAATSKTAAAASATAASASASAAATSAGHAATSDTNAASSAANAATSASAAAAAAVQAETAVSDVLAGLEVEVTAVEPGTAPSGSYNHATDTLSMSIPKGNPGAAGPAGADGTTGPVGPAGPYYTPAISSGGVISWTNNGGLANPSSVDFTKALTEGIQNLGSLAGAKTINCVNGNYAYGTVTAATTLTLTPNSSGRLRVLTLELTNGGAFTITWPTSITWQDGTAPTLTASGVDIVNLITRDNGATWRGVLVGQAFA